MLLSAQSIMAYSRAGMIKPFVPEKVREVDGRGIVSFGLGGAGYDLRLTNKWKVCVPMKGVKGEEDCIIDVKNPDTWQVFDEFEADECIIPPNSFVLGSSVEQFAIPGNVMGIAFGKSTYARLGANALVTPLEPGWAGYLTIEITNNSPYPTRIYAGEGIVQVIFAQLDHATSLPYTGRYQDQQSGITMPSMEE